VSGKIGFADQFHDMSLQLRWMAASAIAPHRLATKQPIPISVIFMSMTASETGKSPARRLCGTVSGRAGRIGGNPRSRTIMKTGPDPSFNRNRSVSLSGKVKPAPFNYPAGRMNRDVAKGSLQTRSRTAWWRTRPIERTRPLR
jgi:hypothetical protein